MLMGFFLGGGGWGCCCWSKISLKFCLLITISWLYTCNGFCWSSLLTTISWLYTCNGFCWSSLLTTISWLYTCNGFCWSSRRVISIMEVEFISFECNITVAFFVFSISSFLVVSFVCVCLWCVWCVHICMYAPCDISRQVPFRTMLEFSMYSLKVKSVALCYLYMCDLGGMGWLGEKVCVFFFFFWGGGSI